MKKFTFLLLTLLTCLGIFAGCTDNRVPQPDEGMEGFEDLDKAEENLQIYDFEADPNSTVSYEEFKSVIHSGLQKANITGEFIPKSTGKKGRFYAFIGSISGKPVVIYIVPSETLTEPSGKPFYYVNSIRNTLTAPHSHYYYDAFPESTQDILIDGHEFGVGEIGFYDFYTGKQLTYEEYLAAHPDLKKLMQENYSDEALAEYLGLTK